MQFKQYRQTTAALYKFKSEGRNNQRAVVCRITSTIQRVF